MTLGTIEAAAGIIDDIVIIRPPLTIQLYSANSPTTLSGRATHSVVDHNPIPIASSADSS